nr:Sec-independent protein translocase subunit TatA [Rhodococcus jostii]
MYPDGEEPPVVGALSPSHWAIIAVVLVVLFGSKKLPDAARGLGRSMRILKSEVGELQADGPELEK